MMSIVRHPEKLSDEGSFPCPFPFASLRVRMTVVVLSLFLLASCSSGNTSSVSIPNAPSSQKAPNFTLLNIQSEPVTLSSFKGKKPVLLFFWATWCPYCRVQMPEVVQLRNRYTADELEILGIDIQEPQSKVASYAAQQGMNYTVLIDRTGAVSAAYNVAGIPMFVLIDIEGNIAETDHTLNKLLRRIDQEIKVQ